MSLNLLTGAYKPEKVRRDRSMTRRYLLQSFVGLPPVLDSVDRDASVRVVNAIEHTISANAQAIDACRTL